VIRGRLIGFDTANSNVRKTMTGMRSVYAGFTQNRLVHHPSVTLESVAQKARRSAPLAHLGNLVRSIDCSIEQETTGEQETHDRQTAPIGESGC